MAFGVLLLAQILCSFNERESDTPPVTVRPRVTTIMTVLIDDLGWADTTIRNPLSPTPHIGQLAQDGINLLQQHAYKYCSPTRRSFLSGRFPVHIGCAQAPVCSNYLPLQFTLLPAKLRLAGFETHMIGKGHLGYQTTDHLPVNRGFDSHFGYLEAAEQYYHGLVGSWADGYNNTHAACHLDKPSRNPSTDAACRYDMWQNNAPAPAQVVDSLYYSTNIFASRAIEKINARATAAPLYIHLTWQNVHGPYSPPPDWETLKSAEYLQNYCGPKAPSIYPHDSRCNFGGSLKAVDEGMKNVTDALKQKGRWEDLLLLVTSDNGGIGPSNNHPLRGSKLTPWQGGTRVTSFLTGGVVPQELRGTSNHAIMHVADWYPTLCNLVGVSPLDTVMMNGTERAIDGIDVWPLLLSGAKDSPREYLPTTEASIIWKGRWKLIVDASATKWAGNEEAQQGYNGWYPLALGPNDTHAPDVSGPTVACTGLFHEPDERCVCSTAHPCLYDIIEDEGEHINLASNYSTIVAHLTKQLGQYKPYVQKSMSAEELSKYECLSTTVKDTAPYGTWWGDFMGPCCRSKNASDSSLLSQGMVDTFTTQNKPQHSPQNLVRNGGFEVGSFGWGVKFEIWQYDTPQLDTRSAWSILNSSEASQSAVSEGERALHVLLAFTPGPLARRIPTCEVMSDYFQAQPNRTLTFSAALKASAPVKAELVLRYQPPGVTLGSLNLPKLTSAVTLSREWQRYTLTTHRLPDSQNSAYAVGLVVDQGDVEIWMDAANVIQANSANYSPNTEIELAGYVGDANSLHQAGKPAPMETILRNNRAVQSTLVLSTIVLGPGYQRVISTERTVTVPPSSSVRTVSDLRSGFLGPHRVYLTATETDFTEAEVVRNTFSFGILEDVNGPTIQKAGKSRFGINLEASPNFTHSLELARKAGFRHGRVMSAGFYWKDFEPNKGNWSTAREKTMHAYTDLLNSYGLEPIALIGRGIPSWAQSNIVEDPQSNIIQDPPAGAFGQPPSEKNLQYYGKHLTRLASSFKGKIEAYETWNEPNSQQWYTGTAQQMGQMLMTQHEGLKTGNPNTTVVALSTMRIENSSSCTGKTEADPYAQPGGQDAGFCKVCWLRMVLGNMTQPASQYWDAFSWHPYRLGSGDPGPESSMPGVRGSMPGENHNVRAEVQAVRAKFSQGKPLWNTEWGWRIPSKFAPDKPEGYTIYASMPPNEDPLTHREEDAAIYYVQQAATAYSYGVDRQFYFLLDEGGMTDRWEFGMIGRSQAYPKAIYLAAAAMIKRTDYASFTQESLSHISDVYVTTVTRGNSEKLILWKAAGAAVDLQIETETTEPLRASDIYGNEFSLMPHQNMVYLTISASPMYLYCKRTDLRHVTTALFQLAAHNETVAIGATTTSLVLRGSKAIPAEWRGIVQAGFLSKNATRSTLANGLNVDVPTRGVVVGEVYEALLWLHDEREGFIGRLSSSMIVVASRNAS